MNFWEKMEKPILCLAPMADVTDAAFRYLIAKYSKFLRPPLRNSKGEAFVMWTEFVSADGLVLAPEEGRKKLLKNFEYSEIERPVVAQIFGSNPRNIYKAAVIVAQLGFDGLDINMGCPDKSVEKQGAGAALMKNPKLARGIIAAAKEGTKLPVSVKTRLGYGEDELEEWLPELLAEEPAVITIHARTRKEMSKVDAHWERIKRAVEIRNTVGSKTLIIGNGDVKGVEDALQKCEETGADGAMLGRAVFGRPWIFSNSLEWLNNDKILEILSEHIKLFDEKFHGVKSFAVMRKHFKAYLSDNKRLRIKMMETRDAKEALEVLYSFHANGAL